MKPRKTISVRDVCAIIDEYVMTATGDERITLSRIKWHVLTQRGHAAEWHEDHTVTSPTLDE